jgi:hypothetical protein
MHKQIDFAISKEKLSRGGKIVAKYYQKIDNNASGAERMVYNR